MTNEIHALPPVGSYWRHKNGNLYQVVLHTNVGADKDEYQPTVVYRNAAHDTWWSVTAEQWVSKELRGSVVRVDV